METEKDDVVVAGFDLLLHRTVQPGRRAGQEQRPLRADLIVQPRKPISARLRQLARGDRMAVSKERDADARARA